MRTKYYRNAKPDEMIMRDHLAYDRTVLANIRTGLGFFRTSLVTFATGLTLLKLFSDEKIFQYISFILFSVSIFMLVFGAIVTYKNAKVLSEVYKK